jgi:hypothetical protein
MGQKIEWSANLELLVMQAVYLIAHMTLVVFLFALVARQNSN